MADIVERLREHRTMSQFQHVSDLIARLNNERDDAADEIERLREVLRIIAENKNYTSDLLARAALGEKE